MNERLLLLNARSFYKVSDVWIAAGEATNAVQVAAQVLAGAALVFQTIWADTRVMSDNIDRDLTQLGAANPELLEQLRSYLDCGGES